MHNAAQHVTARIGGFSTHYVVAGQGEPVLLIHGLASSVLSWHYTIGPLAKFFKVYAMDLPGHGFSEKLVDTKRYTIEESTRFLNAFCETLQIERTHVVGHSMGGLVALEFALAYPEKVKKLVVAGSAGLGRELAPLLRILSLPVIGEILEQPTLPNVLGAWERSFYDKSVVIDVVRDNIALEDYLIQNLKGNKEAFLALLRLGVNIFGLRDRMRVTEKLHRIAVPTLIVWGKNDAIVPVAHAYTAAERIRNATLHIFESCGHLPQIEKKDEFNRIVTEFLIPSFDSAQDAILFKDGEHIEP